MSTSRVWISAISCGSCLGFGALQQGGALEVGGEHEIDRAPSVRPAPPARRARCFSAGGQRYGRRSRRRSRRRSCGTASSCRRRCGRRSRAPRPRGHENGGLVEEKPRAEPVGEIVDGEHGLASRAFAVDVQRRRRGKGPRGRGAARRGLPQRRHKGLRQRLSWRLSARARPSISAPASRRRTAGAARAHRLEA